MATTVNSSHLLQKIWLEFTVVGAVHSSGTFWWAAEHSAKSRTPPLRVRSGLLCWVFNELAWPVPINEELPLKYRGCFGNHPDGARPVLRIDGVGGGILEAGKGGGRGLWRTCQNPHVPSLTWWSQRVVQDPRCPNPSAGTPQPPPHPCPLQNSPPPRSLPCWGTAPPQMRVWRMTEVILPTALRRAPSWPHFIDGEMYLWTRATVITSLCPHSCPNEPGLHFVLVYGGLCKNPKWHSQMGRSVFCDGVVSSWIGTLCMTCLSQPYIRCSPAPSPSYSASLRGQEALPRWTWLHQPHCQLTAPSNQANGCFLSQVLAVSEFWKAACLLHPYRWDTQHSKWGKGLFSWEVPWDFLMYR